MKIKIKALNIVENQVYAFTQIFSGKIEDLSDEIVSTVLPSGYKLLVFYKLEN